MTKEEYKRVPDGWCRYHGENIMSNYDHEIIQETAEAIKGHPYCSHYPGWNFSGEVWWEDGQWHCEIWQYHSYMETFSADSLEQIMSDVSGEYGYE